MLFVGCCYLCPVFILGTVFL
uniref:Uncharacterized protein n=1 Tax=Rhizophora mucronata TaxID=61149 RepID=A0A2P2NL49_RHIMU